MTERLRLDRCVSSFAAALLALASVACSTTLRAEVVDAQTGQPLPDAVVVGVWTRVAGFLHSHDELAGVRETITDAAGRFVLERQRYAGLGGDGDGESITVYRPGFVAWNNQLVFPGSARRPQHIVPATIALQRFPDLESHDKHLRFIEEATRSWLYRAEVVPELRRALRRERETP